MNAAESFRTTPTRDGRRRSTPSIRTTRDGVRRMSRSGGQFHDELAYLYHLTGIISDKRQRGRITTGRAVRALQACWQVSRHLAQGNLARAWIAMVGLLDVFGVTSQEVLALPQHTPIRTLFVLLTENEDRWPDWEAIPPKTLLRFAALGVDLRPMSVQMGATGNLGDDPAAAAFQRDIDAAGHGGVYDMSAEPPTEEEAVANK